MIATGRSVTGMSVTGRSVTGRSVTGSSGRRTVFSRVNSVC